MTEDLEATRARSFGQVAERYDAFRPPMPAELGHWLGITTGTPVLDVAAGTGLATRTWVGLGAQVTAVEPDPAMAAQLRRGSPSLLVHEAVAEDLPLPDASFEVLTICSAWHWCDPTRAGAEAARVLVDGGTLGIAWNGFDRSVEWVAELAALREPSGEPSPSARHHLDDDHVPPSLPFLDSASTEIPWIWTRTLEEILELMGTFSGVLVVDRTEYDRIRVEAQALLEHHASSEGTIALPMSARGWRATRAPR